MKTRADVQKLMEEIFAECQKTRDAGQKEYAHDEENALANFERTGAELALPREKVWYIFAKKHWDGVLAWINGHRSQREDVRGRIKDLIVYLVLLQAMIEDDTLTKDLPTCGNQWLEGSVTKQQFCKFKAGHAGSHSFQLEQNLELALFSAQQI